MKKSDKSGSKSKVELTEQELREKEKEAREKLNELDTAKATLESAKEHHDAAKKNVERLNTEYQVLCRCVLEKSEERDRQLNLFNASKPIEVTTEPPPPPVPVEIEVKILPTSTLALPENAGEANEAEPQTSKQRVLSQLELGAATAVELGTELKMNKHTLRRVLGELIDARLIAREERGEVSYYFLPEQGGA